jgi:hypothetical protein
MKCNNNHNFDSWFQSSEAFEKLASSGMLSCIHCGDTNISKSLMAPKVTTKKIKEKLSLTAPKGDIEKALAKLKLEVEKNSDYVGMNFATEARAMHDGDQPSRSIYGEAKPEEAKALIEDGVPVTPLPFMPKRKTN